MLAGKKQDRDVLRTYIAGLKATIRALRAGTQPADIQVPPPPAVEHGSALLRRATAMYEGDLPMARQIASQIGTRDSIDTEIIALRRDKTAISMVPRLGQPSSELAAGPSADEKKSQIALWFGGVVVLGALWWYMKKKRR